MEETARELLEKHGQAHLLRYFEALNESQKAVLLNTIRRIDFAKLQKALFAVGKKSGTDAIAHMKVLTLQEIERRKTHFYELGLKSLQNGEVGAVILAGGQGTRLGSDKPKGMFDVGLKKSMPIFQIHAENARKRMEECGALLHLFIMTNESSHEEVVRFFSLYNNFGFNARYLHFYPQDMNPAVDKKGKILMKSPWQPCMAPSGNGGWSESLMASDSAQFVRDGKMKWLNVVSVDNVLQKTYDPVFIGATIASGCACGAKVVKKCSPDEKVGAICLRNGKPSVVEYYELSEEMKTAVDDEGKPIYDYGVTLNYLFSVARLEATLHMPLPVHVAQKKVPYMDEHGAFVKPDQPNAYKFETLILDMIEYMETCLPYEINREEEFAPIKNRTGVDSLETARAMLLRKMGEL